MATRKKSNKSARVAIFWDLQNVNPGRTSKINSVLVALLELAEARGKINIFNVYGSLPEKQKPDFEGFCRLRKARYIPILSKEKDALDCRLVHECVRTIESQTKPEIVILVAGDGDYKFLVKLLRGKNIHVVVFAKEGSASTQLQQSASEFHWVSKLLPSQASA